MYFLKMKLEIDRSYTGTQIVYSLTMTVLN